MEGFARLPVEIRNIIKKKIVQAEEESFIEWWWTVVSLASEFNGEESPLRACFLIGFLKLAINDPFAEVCLSKRYKRWFQWAQIYGFRDEMCSRWWNKCHFNENNFIEFFCRSDSDVIVIKNGVIMNEDYMKRKREEMYDRIMKNFVYLDRVVIENDI